MSNLESIHTWKIYVWKRIPLFWVFCIIIWYFECFYEIQYRFLYIWTEYYYALQFSKIPKTLKIIVYIYIYIYKEKTTESGSSSGALGRGQRSLGDVVGGKMGQIWHFGNWCAKGGGSKTEKHAHHGIQNGKWGPSEHPEGSNAKNLLRTCNKLMQRTFPKM